MTIDFGDSIGYTPGEYIAKVSLNPIPFPTVSRGTVSNMAGGSVERFVVLKAGPTGEGYLNTHTTVVGMNIDESSTGNAITLPHWAYCIIVGY